MRRGTTPLHTFTFPSLPSAYSVIDITYKQNGRGIVTKTKSDLSFTNKVGQVRLTQEETLKFSSRTPAEIQVSALTPSGEALKTSTGLIPIEEALSDKVLEV